MKIDTCPSCGREHLEVSMFAYQRPGVFTHWYECPETGDPIPVSVSVSGRLIDQEISDALALAAGDDRWLCIVYRVHGNQLIAFWKTHQFPNGDLPVVLADLKVAFARVMEGKE